MLTAHPYAMLHFAHLVAVMLCCPSATSSACVTGARALCCAHALTYALHLLPPNPPNRLPQDDLGVILSSCQRLGIAPSAEWQDILAQAYLSTIDTPEKAESVRSDFFVKPLVGLAGMGWKPTPEQWQVVLQASATLLPLGYFKARQLLETAWAMAQFGTPVPQQWASVGGGWLFVSCWQLLAWGIKTPYACQQCM